LAGLIINYKDMALTTKKTDEYTRYCITPEGKEYLRKMLEEKKDAADTDNDIDNEFELDMNEEIDFENLQIFDIDDDDFEPDDLDILENEFNRELNDEFFRLNEKPNDDDYDLWKETQ